MPLSNEQDKTIAKLRSDGWGVRGVLTTPAVNTDRVAVDGDGPVRVVVTRGQLERRYDIAVDGRAEEVGITANFGPHQNPALKG